jgi:hypothetical protein
VALALVLAAVVTEPVAAWAVGIQAPRRISLASPFSGACTLADPNFSRGIAVETSVAVDPRDRRRILVAWIQDGAASDLVMASRDGGRTFSRVLVRGLSACTGGALQVASDPGVAFAADGHVAYFSGVGADILSLSPFTTSSSMAASRSVDGGVSWSAPVFRSRQTAIYT